MRRSRRRPWLGRTQVRRTDRSCAAHANGDDSCGGADLATGGHGPTARRKPMTVQNSVEPQSTCATAGRGVWLVCRKGRSRGNVIQDVHRGRARHGLVASRTHATWRRRIMIFYQRICDAGAMTGPGRSSPVTAGLLRRAGRGLLVHRTPTPLWYPDCWDLPAVTSSTAKRLMLRRAASC